jgi:RNA polymerase sigma-70 factor (ECF subfamily)
MGLSTFYRQKRSGGTEAFETTHWSVVLRAGQGQEPQAQAALEKLCAAYWYPLYAFVRKRGHPPPEAEDLVQGFFARLLTKKFLGSLRPEGGKFRSYLLTALKHFLANEWDRQQAQKRGGGKVLVSIDATAEARYQREPIE